MHNLRLALPAVAILNWESEPVESVTVRTGVGKRKTIQSNYKRSGRRVARRRHPLARENKDPLSLIRNPVRWQTAHEFSELGAGIHRQVVENRAMEDDEVRSTR